MTEPAEPDLETIQRLQFSDLARAQELAREWLAREFGIVADSVVLRPSAVALNSFNGVYTHASERTFFKSHIEPGSTIREYYNARVLDEAGYAMVMPLRVETQEGRQIAFYPVIDEPTVFDRVRRYEQGTDASAADAVLAAEAKSASDLLTIYRRSAQRVDAETNRNAPVHQLFSHRLTQGRLDSFYGHATVAVPTGPVLFERLRGLRWIINGVEQPRTLGELIDEAKVVLDPDSPALGVVGHGDAHFGNVFLENGAYLYFDPAFAGRHDPLLDITKPLFHNVFAAWLYHPQEAAARVSVDAGVVGDTLRIDYGPHLTGYRQELHALKQRGLVAPVLEWLTSEGALPHGRRLLDLALMCCPLLTMNLCDSGRFPASVSLLGLALAVQMGNGDVEQELRLGRADAVPNPHTEGVK